ncbi:MAG: hypothetical protein ABSD57_05775 [Verrucomicrobiota bacterium]
MSGAKAAVSGIAALKKAECVGALAASPDMSGLSFLESVPDVSAKLKAPVTADRKFEDVVKSAQQAAVLVLVY